jgi:hypothetical protein
MIVGQLVLGLIMPFTLIPGLPEMTDSALVHYKKSQHERINNLASGLYNMVLGVGEVAGPLYGTFVAAQVGFRETSDILAIVFMIFAISYYVFAGGKEAF